MEASITARQRDALHERIVDSLSGIGDVFLTADSDDIATAERLGRVYSNELMLVCDDLGWGVGPRVVAIELSTPPEVVLRLFGRPSYSASSEREARSGDWEESREPEERNRLVDEACTSVIRDLEGVA